MQLSRIFIQIILASVLFVSVPVNSAFAEHNSNIKGLVKSVLTYTDHDDILIQLENQPTTHPVCNPTHFVISGDFPVERRNMLLSRLLSAYHAKEVLNIGYDHLGNCVNGRIRVHRIG